MSTERLQQAVGYVRVATAEEIGTGAQIERHKHTVISYCLDSGLRLTHMIIDIGGRAGRGRALDLLVMERAAVLVVPSLAQLARRSAELVPMLGHYFCPPSGVAGLVAVAEGIDTRTAAGRLAIDVLRCLARFESEGVYHA